MFTRILRSLSAVAARVAGRASMSLVVFGLATPCLAGQLEDGVFAAKHRDYAQAIRLLIPLAEGGDAAAQFNVGALYEHGRGVPQDPAQAVDWYRRSADQGFPYGQFSLADMYYKGRGVQKDAVAAFVWFKLSSTRFIDDCNKEDAVIHAMMVSMIELTDAQRQEAGRLVEQWQPTNEYAVTEDHSDMLWTLVANW